MKGLAAANYIWSRRILAAVKSNSKGKTWAAIAVALIGALIVVCAGECAKSAGRSPETRRGKARGHNLRELNVRLLSNGADRAFRFLR